MKTLLTVLSLSLLLTACSDITSAVSGKEKASKDSITIDGMTLEYANMPDEPLEKPLEIVREPKKIAIGEWSVGVKEDGSLWTWGSRASLKSIKSDAKPQEIKGISNVVSVSGGITNNTLILKKDGTVWGWGRNYLGQIDPNDKNEFLDNIRKIDGIENVVDISAGMSDSIFLTRDGEVFGIGENKNGWMNGLKGSLEQPTKIANLKNIIRIEFQNGVLLALNKKGELFSTGKADYALGRKVIKSTNNIKYYPAEKVILPKKVVDFYASTSHAMALLEDGSVWMWGASAVGRLATKIKGDIILPKKNNLLNQIININEHSAVSADGDLYVWGKFGYGNTKAASVTTFYKPIKIMSNLNSLQLHDGLRASAVIQKDGSVYFWNWNDVGQRGNGSFTTGEMSKRYVLTPEKSLFQLN